MHAEAEHRILEYTVSSYVHRLLKQELPPNPRLTTSRRASATEEHLLLLVLVFLRVATGSRLHNASAVLAIVQSEPI